MRSPRFVRPIALAAVLLVFGVSLSGCNRAGDSTKVRTQEAKSESTTTTDERERTTEPSASPSKSRPSNESTTSTRKYALPDASRIVAIGDLHGDFEVTRKVLRLAGAVDENDEWSGGELVLVQTGDQLDRGDGEREIVDLFYSLKRQAKKAGGSVVVLNGNHETMNVMGDFRYVTPRAIDSFAGLSPASPLAAAVSGRFASRAAAFLPGGAMALRFAERPIIAVVGETAFVHGGLRGAHVSYGIDRINREASDFMRGKSQRPPAPLVDQEGPLWTRIYGGKTVTPAACAELTEVLTRVGAKRLVVGHTVQRGGISAECDGKVHRIDVGMSSAYGGDTVQALEIVGDRVRMLKEGP